MEARVGTVKLATMSRRHAVIGALATVLLGGCKDSGGTASADVWPSSPASGLDAAKSLLDDAEHALDEAFPGLSWRDGEQVAPSEDHGTCTYETVSRVCDRYLGKETGEPEAIANALRPVLSAHGLTSLAGPQGDDGGWLVVTSSHGGIDFEFRSKGLSIIRAAAVVRGECLDVSDGG